MYLFSDHCWCKHRESAKASVEDACSADPDHKEVHKLYCAIERQLSSCSLCITGYHIVQVSKVLSGPAPLDI
jgi:hypothetical protein